MFTPDVVAEMDRLTDEAVPFEVEFDAAGSSSDTGDEYNPLDDRDTGGSAPQPVLTTLRAVQIKSDPARFAANGLSLINAVSLKVLPKEGFEPLPGMAMLWAGKRVAVKFVKPVGPSGTPVHYIVDGNA